MNLLIDIQDTEGVCNVYVMFTGYMCGAVAGVYYDVWNRVKFITI